jgi:hypothetical protein
MLYGCVEKMKTIELKRVDAAYCQQRISARLCVLKSRSKLTLLNMKLKAATIVEMLVRLLTVDWRSKIKNQMLNSLSVSNAQLAAPRNSQENNDQADRKHNAV